MRNSPQMPICLAIKEERQGTKTFLGTIGWLFNEVQRENQRAILLGIALHNEANVFAAESAINVYTLVLYKALARCCKSRVNNE